MKLLFATGIYPPEIGGPASFTRQMAHALVSRGVHVEVVTYGDTQTETSSEWNIHVVSRRGGVLVRYLRYAIATWKAARSCDIVFLQGPVSEGLPGTIGAWLAGKPTLMKIVGDYAWEQYQQRTEHPELLDEFIQGRHRGQIRLLEWFERWTTCRARVVVTPSQYLKKIVQAWGVSEDRIQVITNSISPLPVVKPREELRRSLDVESKTVLLTAMRAVPWKGGDFLIKLLTELPATHLLVIAGDGPRLDSWKKLAQELGVSGRCRFLGKIDRIKLAEWYEAADTFLLASGYEGFPHVVVEAVSRGLPCLVSDKGGNTETKELFAAHVQVLPYLDTSAWKEAILHLPQRKIPAPIKDFSQVVEEYLATISQYAK
jgi:glycosyltransferase involved in cell wall biosynthesis